MRFRASLDLDYHTASGSGFNTFVHQAGLLIHEL